MPQPPRRPRREPRPLPALRPRRAPAKVVPRNSPLVSLRFREGVNVPRTGAAEATMFMEESFRDEWTRLRAMFPGMKLVPASGHIPLERLEGLAKRAREKNPNYRPPRFKSMFRLELPPRKQWPDTAPKGPHMVERLRELLLGSLPVDRVVVEALLAPPPLRDDPGGTADMWHLDPAPKGLGVSSAWTFPAGQGGNVIFGVVERGWVTSHADFVGKSFVRLGGGFNFATGDDEEHGTMVLGLIMALKQGAGVVGVAPQAANAVLSCEVRALDNENKQVIVTSEAILDAILELAQPLATKGAVLLIESQVSMNDYDSARFPAEILGPSELNPDVYDYIEFAVQLGIVVVECAGNGGVESAQFGLGVDLDDPLVAGLLHGESGAIIVGEATWVDGTGHKLIPLSCTGQRIDCFSWGDQVTALTNSAVPLGGFGGTSAAGAIVAGAAVLLQGFAASSAATGNKPLDPATMRSALRDREINTPLADGTNDMVGVQPNLKAICQQLGLIPII